jgi:hypothetical protein
VYELPAAYHNKSVCTLWCAHSRWVAQDGAQHLRTLPHACDKGQTSNVEGVQAVKEAGVPSRGGGGESREGVGMASSRISRMSVSCSRGVHTAGAWWLRMEHTTSAYCSDPNTLRA